MNALDRLNALDMADFVAALAGIFERSPWVAEGVVARRPFASIEALHEAMVDVVRRAPIERQLALLRAHPDLAGKEAREGTLTAESRSEQRGAGLDRFSAQQMATIARNNAAYRRRFGFPFIVCVRNYSRDEIFAEFEARLQNEPADELRTALEQVGEIARLRLQAALGTE